MGLDMYISAEKNGRSKEIAYFRKRPSIHGWMETLWEERGCPMPDGEEVGGSAFGSSFNGIPLELSAGDIKRLEEDIRGSKLPYDTVGFFFGKDEPNEDDRREDLEVIKKVKGYLKRGWSIIYNSWW